MTKNLQELRIHAAMLICSLLLGACSFMSQQSAPVDMRTPTGSVRGGGISSGGMTAAKPSGKYQHMAGKAGYYSVLPGDTVYAIARNQGVSPRDLIAWNEIENPNSIEVGQVLLISPPSGVATTSPVPDTTVSSRPLPTSKPVPVPSKPVMTPRAPPTTSPARVDPAAAVDWTWPANGRVLAKFDGNRNKGVDISGADGADVYAAADGVVMIAAAQRGYGNLLVVKHNDDVLTAYAHNRALLVKEGQTVKRGQAVANMGNLDTDRVKLHFQIRIKTQPVNPELYLPRR